jgi:hypothetical protein
MEKDYERATRLREGFFLLEIHKVAKRSKIERSICIIIPYVWGMRERMSRSLLKERVRLKVEVSFYFIENSNQPFDQSSSRTLEALGE